MPPLARLIRLRASCSLDRQNNLSARWKPRSWSTYRFCGSTRPWLRRPSRGEGGQACWPRSRPASTRPGPATTLRSGPRQGHRPHGSHEGRGLRSDEVRRWRNVRPDRRRGSDGSCGGCGRDRAPPGVDGTGGRRSRAGSPVRPGVLESRLGNGPACVRACHSQLPDDDPRTENTRSGSGRASAAGVASSES